MIDKKIDDNPMVQVIAWVVVLWIVVMVLLVCTVGVVRWLF